MPVSARTLFDVLYPGELTPQWNSQCAMSEVCSNVLLSPQLFPWR